MTLQQQYNLIKEGKGNKDFFLKQARHLFPDYLTVHNTYEQTVGILRGKSIISEAVGGVVTLDNKKPDWFKIFDTNLKEAIGVKNTKEYGDQNEFEKIDSETQKILDKTNFDYKDPKNIDNVYGQTFLNGYYTEMKDPKNGEKTVDELKQIVAKNLGKDINYYVKDGAFGVKGLGYSSEPTGGEPKPPKGKYKSSGYGDLPKAKVIKEGKDEDKIARYEKYTYTLDGKNVTPDDIAFYNNSLGAELDGKVYKMGMPDENGNVELNMSKGKTGMYTESKHGDEADLKIYKSELNLINKTKASGEKQLKRKAELEKKIADLEKKQTESLKENQNIRHKITRADKTRKDEIVFLNKEYNIKNTTDKKNYDLADSYRIILSPGDEIKATNTESLNEATESMDFSAKDQKDWSEQKSKTYDVWANKSNELVDLKDDLKKAKNRNDKDEVKRINNKILQKQIAIKTAKEEFQKLSESLTEAKKLTVQKRIQELEKQNEIQALESKIASISEAIEELQSRLALTETDEVKELIDPRKFKEMQKEIKILEKYKAKCEKIYEKMSKSKKSAPSDDDMINEYFEDNDSNMINEYFNQ